MASNYDIGHLVGIDDRISVHTARIESPDVLPEEGDRRCGFRIASDVRSEPCRTPTIEADCRPASLSPLSSISDHTRRIVR